MAATRGPAFIGRRRECEALDQVLKGVRLGDSAALVIRGEAGIGKTALLDYTARRASGCQVARIVGVESELDMPFAALHQLCAPMLGHVSDLPEPQQRALQVVFGMAVGSAPDTFLVGLAVLSLLAEVAASQPLVALIDDAQWLDDPSRHVLSFVGRRLVAEGVLIVFGVREGSEERLFPALPDLTVGGLTDDDARELFAAAHPGRLSAEVRERVVAETRGNPLWLLELAKGSHAELVGGFGVSSGTTTSAQLQDHYLRRIRSLPEATQRLMLLAAAEPTGLAALVWRAAYALGIGRDAAGPAGEEQLLEIGASVRFRHPLVRSAAYAAGSPEDRRAAHTALAAAMDPEADPEHHVWHCAAAATGPDEGVASRLERVAMVAEARAGPAAAATLQERSVALTADPERRAHRALAAAEANLQAGAFEAALRMLAVAEASAVDDLQRAGVERLKGEVLAASNPGRDAPVILRRAAEQLEPLDVLLARETYLEGWMASLLVGRHAGPGGGLPEISRAARSAAQPPDTPRSVDLFLDGAATLVTEGRAAAVPSLRRAVNAFLGDLPAGDWLRWGRLAQVAAGWLWDADSWDVLSARHVQVARASGALAPLSIALNGRGVYVAWSGDLEATTAVIAEEQAVYDVTGIQIFSVGALLRAAYVGRPIEGGHLISATARDSTARGQGMGTQLANWTAAILQNGLGRYAEAMSAAAAAADEMEHPFATAWALPELIEAAVRAGNADRANDALRRLLAETDVPDSDWASGIEARSRALVTEGAEAGRWYAEAVERLGRTPLRTELARAHLVYGEWLRRENRRVDARVPLRAAYDLFAAMGAEAFAERTRRELLATGEKVGKREVDAGNDLRPQEEHIARLARDGRTNAEIGSELFLSARTVEWHMRNVFTKLGITSRKELPQALPARGQSRHGPSSSAIAQPLG